MAQQRRTFTEEFKREAVNLVKQSGEKPATVARDLGIDGNVLARWCREAEPAKESEAGGKYSVEEFERMRRELAKVKTERDILKKALGYFAVDPK